MRFSLQQSMLFHVSLVFYFCVTLTVLRNVPVTTEAAFADMPLPNTNIKRIQPSRRRDIISLSVQASSEIDWEKVKDRVVTEAKELYDCANLIIEPLFQPDAAVTAQTIVQICDEIDKESQLSSGNLLSRQLRRRALESRRYELLAKLLRHNSTSYVAVASFLSPSRIPRDQLPNVQDVLLDPGNDQKSSSSSQTQNLAVITDEFGMPLVADCTIQDVVYRDTLLDKVLLDLFRNLVAKNTGGVRSDLPGIQGLMEQARTFMLQPNQTAAAQHQMTYETLSGLMTPVLPPFYRIFMSGIVPTFRSDDNQTGMKKPLQLGPWFYAPWLTSIVTPLFFQFLVGPSRPNRRRDGQHGGLLVEKCKFLQESGCKGLCLHQCKLPAQQFFATKLGLPLSVSPNFETQECQWSFGEIPLPPDIDPHFPKGCLVGCESRRQVAGRKVDLCSA